VPDKGGVWVWYEDLMSVEREESRVSNVLIRMMVPEVRVAICIYAVLSAGEIVEGWF